MITRIASVALVCWFFMVAGLGAVDKKPPVVEVAQPVEQVIADHATLRGLVEAAESVELRARVTGYLTKIDFKPGDDVKRGDLLFEIDPRPYQLALDAAELGIRRAEAELTRAKADLDRLTPLAQKGTVSREELDRATSIAVEAKVKVQVAQVEREHANLTLSFTRVIAPIAGKIGEPALTPGNLVKADDSVLGRIDSVDPVHVGIQLNERTLLRAVRTLRESKDKAARIAVAMKMADDKDFPHRGKIDFIDSRVDPKTGSIRARSVFANPKGMLLPGMSVTVRLATSAPYKVLALDPRALGEHTLEDDGIPLETHVPVVNGKNIVESRKVLVRRNYDLLVVEKGLTEADLVIVSDSADPLLGTTVQPKRVPAKLQIGEPKKKS